MKKIFLYFLPIIFLQHTQGQTSIPIYYSPVTMPVSLKNNYYSLFDTKLMAADLAGLLKQATGQSFTPMVYDAAATKGIFLLLDNNDKSEGNETGTIDGDGKNFIRITARYTTGISYAMYSWLQELGFRFYLPGDDWIIVPSLNNVFNNKIDKKIYKPYFHIRIFGSSMPAVKGLDDTLRNNRDWQQWQMRNRMGCDYIKIGGHVGEVFNVTHQKEIEADTSILAPFNGKRQYSSGGKLDPTYKKGVSLFTDWVVELFKKDQSTFPSFLPFKKYFSADPGDGLNYCHTPECERQFKTVSDQVFSIANEAARKIKLADPRAGISTMAYAERADTPGIRLEPNLHSMVVATGYQHVTTAAELVKRWKKKSNNISVYDYLNVVRLNDKPFFNLYRYFNNLEFLRSMNIEGFTIETSYAKFATGIQQYFILKYLCEPYSTIDDQFDRFCKENFGNAAPAIKKLFKEWYFSDAHLQTNSDYPSFDAGELGRFVQYISDAENSPGLTVAIKKRIDELKAYMVHLCKYYELYAEFISIQEYKKDPATRIQKAEEDLTYTWQLYDTKIFHNSLVNDLLLNLLPKDLKQKWNYRGSDHFKDLKTDVSALVKNEFEKVRKKYLPLAEPVYPITDEFLEANIKNSADSIRIVTTDEAAIQNYIYPIQFYCGAPGILKINYQADSSKTKDKADKVAIISIESSDYKFIKTDIVYKGNSSGVLIYNIPSKGHYRLFLSQYNATHVSYIIYPGKNLLYDNNQSIQKTSMMLQDYEKKNYCSNKWLAIYAPPVDSLHFSNLYIESVNTSRFYDAGGKALTVRAGSQPFYYSVAVPKDQKNNFIFFENSSYRLPPVLKNTAPYYFFLKYPLK